VRVLVATTATPFVRGGAEIHAEELVRAVRERGHQAELIAIPFKWYPPERILDQILACRLFDLTESDGFKIDRLIGLKFPAYLIPHPSKVLWILHQHRPAYDLWEHSLGDLVNYPDGAQVRDAIQQADQAFIPEARALFANSCTVADRLKKYCGLHALPLYHPPRDADGFYAGRAEEYLFFPSRLTPNKRQHLVLEALAQTRNPVRVRFASSSDHATYAAELQSLVHRLGLEQRVEFLGDVDEIAKRDLYAHARGILYPPVDEDYGYVTLEAMLSAKPVITCSDSGGPLEFVRNEGTGLIAAPTAQALALAMDAFWEDAPRAAAMGEVGRQLYDSLDISWDHVVERLLCD
jgi:glycosyltransferase involved in cell wall biosynthesis